MEGNYSGLHFKLTHNFIFLIINSLKEAVKSLFFLPLFGFDFIYDNYHFNFNIVGLLLNNEKNVSIMNNSILQKYNVPGPRYTSYPTVPYWDEGNFTNEIWIETLKKSFV